MEFQSDQTNSYAGKWGAMFAIGLGIFMGTLDMSIVNISLPTLVEQLHARFATIQWVVLSYVLVITSTMLGAARLGDMYEKKKVYNWGLVVFTAGSLLCGLSPGVEWLIAFRVLQGFGSVITQALGTAIIVEAFPPYERGRALGMVGSIASVGISLGPPIGGLIIGWAGWQWVFLINVPIGIIASLASNRFLVSRPPRELDQSFDITGALILFATLCCFALAMTVGQNQGFKNSLVLTLIAIAVVGIFFFLAVEKKMKQPMVDLTLFRNFPFSLNLMRSFLSFIPISGIFLMPFYLQLVKHYPTHQIGLMMMVTPATMALLAPFSGTLSDRYGTRGISMAGLLMIGIGCLLISTLDSDTGVLGYLLRLFPLGIGLALFHSPNNSAVMGAARPERLGVASGLLSLTRSLGQTTGMPIMGAIFSATVLASAGIPALTDITAAPPRALVEGIRIAYHTGAVVIFTSAILTSLALWATRNREENQSTS